jgi:hypothetical protein
MMQSKARMIQTTVHENDNVSNVPGTDGEDVMGMAGTPFTDEEDSLFLDEAAYV